MPNGSRAAEALGRPNAVLAIIALHENGPMGAVALADAIGAYRNGGIKIARHLEAHNLVRIRIVGQHAGRDAYAISLTPLGENLARGLLSIDSLLGKK